MSHNKSKVVLSKTEARQAESGHGASKVLALSLIAAIIGLSVTAVIII